MSDFDNVSDIELGARCTDLGLLVCSMLRKWTDAVIDMLGPSGKLRTQTAEAKILLVSFALFGVICRDLDFKRLVCSVNLSRSDRYKQRSPEIILLVALLSLKLILSIITLFS